MIFIHLFSEPWVAYMSPLPRCALSESSCGFNHPKPCTNNLFLLASATIPILLQILKCASLGTLSFYFLTSIFSHKFPLQFLEPLVNTSSIPFRVPQMLYTSLLRHLIFCHYWNSPFLQKPIIHFFSNWLFYMSKLFTLLIWVSPNVFLLHLPLHCFAKKPLCPYLTLII